MPHLLRTRLLLLVLSAIFVAKAHADSHPLSASVRLFEHEGVVLQLAEIDPDDERITPLVILLGGAEGGLWFGVMGRHLLREGFSTLSLSYFGHEGQPARLTERPLEPIAASISLARQSRGATHRCVALVGVSKGGELALLLSAYENDMPPGRAPLADAIVAAAPSHVVWQAPHVSLLARSSWSMGGEPLPFLPYPWLSRHVADVFLDRLRVGPYHQDALRNDGAVARAIIPVERIQQPILLLAGAQDEMWPSADMARAALERAERLNPGTPLRLDIRELDHFVLSDEEARAAVTDFIWSAIRAEVLAGRCEADLPE